MKALKAYNTEAINRFHQRMVHNTEIVETPQNDLPEPPVPENDPPDLPESDQDMKNSGLILVVSMWILFRKPWNSLPDGESPYPIHSL